MLIIKNFDRESLKLTTSEFKEYKQMRFKALQKELVIKIQRLN